MDTLDELALQAKALVKSGYYDGKTKAVGAKAPSLRDAVLSKERAVLAEIKTASPTAGVLRSDADVGELAMGFKGAGARGLSVITEPKTFGGSLERIAQARSSGLPVLMKDFVVSTRQIDSAALNGASSILLIATLFKRGHVDVELTKAVEHAHALGLETLTEATDALEYQDASRSGTDLLGINNRDLSTMSVDITRTVAVLKSCGKLGPTISLSGVETRTHADLLFSAGADGILVGTSLMREADPAAKLRTLTGV